MQSHSATDLFDTVDRQLRRFIAEARFDRHNFFGGAAVREFDIRNLIEQRMGQFKTALDRCTDVPLPKTIHRLWLTSVEAGSMPPTVYLEQIAAQAREIEAACSCVLWCNSPGIRAQIGGFFEASDAPVSVRDFASEFHGSECFGIIQRFVDHRKYVLAADVAKIVLLERFGGIYADMGVQFPAHLLGLIAHADAAVFLDAGLFFQPAFMAFRAHDGILQLWLEMLRDPEILSSFVLSGETGFSPGHEIWLHAGVGFTAIFVLLQPLHYRVLVLPPQGAALQTHSQGSWYQPGNKFGNLILDEATVTHLDFGKHRAYFERLDTSLSRRSAGEVRTKILSCLHGAQATGAFWLS